MSFILLSSWYLFIGSFFLNGNIEMKTEGLFKNNVKCDWIDVWERSKWIDLGERLQEFDHFHLYIITIKSNVFCWYFDIVGCAKYFERLFFFLIFSHNRFGFDSSFVFNSFWEILYLEISMYLALGCLQNVREIRMKKGFLS